MTEKMMAIHWMFESIKLYMILVQPSRVIIWKIVISAMGKWSNTVIP